MNNACKFYISLTNFTPDEPTLEIFNTYKVEYQIINTIGKESLLVCLIRDRDDLETFKTVISKLSPVLIGKYKQDGYPIGVEKIKEEVTGDIEVEKVIIPKEPLSVQLTGTAELTFNKTKYLKLAKDDVEYETVGEETSIKSITRPLKCKMYHNFAGWEDDKEY